MLQQLLSKLWYPKKSQTLFIATALVVIKLLLLLPSLVYGVCFYLIKAYKTSIKRSIAIDTPLISVGNISVGGTGKTEVICSLVQEIGADSVVVVAKGYNANRAETFPVLLSLESDAETFGDEPVMVKRRCNCEVIVSQRKLDGVLYANELIQQHKITSKVILIDDGYQQFSLPISKNILLLDAEHPFGNGFLLPLGPLREYDITRADSIIVTGSSILKLSEKKALLQKIRENLTKRIKISFADYVSTLQTHTKKVYAGSDLKKTPVILLAGIARPEKFFEPMQKKTNTVGVLPYPDHHSYTSNDIRNILIAASTNKAKFIITTRKDWVKICPLLHPFDWEKFLISSVSIRQIDSELLHE